MQLSKVGFGILCNVWLYKESMGDRGNNVIRGALFVEWSRLKALITSQCDEEPALAWNKSPPEEPALE